MLETNHHGKIQNPAFLDKFVRGYMIIFLSLKQAIKFLRNRESKPYIVYIKPPVLDKLRESRLKQGSRITMEDGTTRPFTVSITESLDG